MTSLQDVPQVQGKCQLKELKKVVKGRKDDYEMITVESLDLMDEEVKRIYKKNKRKKIKKTQKDKKKGEKKEQKETRDGRKEKNGQREMGKS